MLQRSFNSPPPFPALNEQLNSLIFLKEWNLNHLKQINSVLITCGLSHHSSYLSKLLRLCLLLPSFPSSYASSLFNQIKRPTIHTWNVMFKGFSITSHPQKSINFYMQMRQDGIFPNKHTFPLLLRAFSKAKNANPLLLLAQIFKFGYISDQFVQNSLVSGLAGSAYVDLARQVFDEITNKDVLSYTALIDGYARNGLPVKALELFVEMRQAEVKVDEVAVVAALSPAGTLKFVWFGRCLHGFYVEAGRVSSDVYIGSTLVDMYAKCGFCDDALKVFEDMPYKNLISWSAMIAGFVHCNRSREALCVFQEMLAGRVVPNQVTFTSVLSASTRLGALEQGRWVARYIKAHKIEINTALGTALIDMYAKCGCIDDALLVFEKLPEKGVYVWTAMINGLAAHGDADKSLAFFLEMLSNGLRPNEVTFVGILTACSHGGLVDEGRRLFSLMDQVYGVKPNIDHYGCMVDLLGRAGYMEEACRLIQDMPMEPTPSIWGALFGSCMIHKAYELGEWIGRHLIDIQPYHSGRYTLLANLYSTCKNWEGVAQVRKMMREMGVEKIRGCSWIELNGEVHEFIAFDGSHAKSEYIYSVLDNLFGQIQHITIFPDADSLILENS
ncbi:PREDICTED: pentatricopeptide repeat-containing protein At1g50270 [Nicotiana attenuata]|uniref:Pentatricopeptide repeat-containing protein n=1 Tax=Nicotiana attenuata TaxID=49451 RepID=A0A1J6KCU3_NICAT|nr:PREDICTED: pentatricopeptide repeat-containing protein At1g50270 [Nicotiana attenuata]OIT22768.1 pentatricopeptide repeat-containing protein [Nicotiana attenuata]